MYLNILDSVCLNGWAGQGSLPGGSRRYQFVFVCLKIRIFRCSYRIYHHTWSCPLYHSDTYVLTVSSTTQLKNWWGLGRLGLGSPWCLLRTAEVLDFCGRWECKGRFPAMGSGNCLGGQCLHGYPMKEILSFQAISPNKCLDYLWDEATIKTEYIIFGELRLFYFWYKGIEGRKWTVLWLTGEWEYVAWLVSATFVHLPFPAGPGWFERRSVGWRLRRIIPTYGGKSIKFPWVYPRVYPNCSMFPTYSQWYCRKLFHYITIMKSLIP